MEMEVPMYKNVSGVRFMCFSSPFPNMRCSIDQNNCFNLVAQNIVHICVRNLYLENR